MLTMTDMRIRLNDLNAAIEDLERQRLDSPDCPVVLDALAAYQTKAARVEVALNRALRDTVAAA